MADFTPKDPGSSAEQHAFTEIQHLKALAFEYMFDGVILTDFQSRIIDWNPAAERIFGYSKAEAQGRTPAFIHTPERVPDLQNEIIASVKEKGLWEGEVPFIGKNGERGICEAVVLPVRDGAGKMIATVGVNRDITQRRATEDQETRQKRMLEALYENSLKINAHLGLTEVLQAITARAASLMGMPMGGLYLVRPDGDSLELVVSYNLPGDFLGSVLEFGEGLSGIIAKTGKPMYVHDYSTWQDQSPIYRGSVLGPVYGVPLKVGDRVIGVINVTGSHPSAVIREDDLQYLSLFADQAAIAVENARLYEEVQRELGERTRLEESEREQRILAEALDETISILTSTLRLDEVLDRILDIAGRVVPHECATIMMVEQGVARIVRSKGYLERGLQEYIERWEMLVDSVANLREMASTGLPMAIPDVITDPKWITFPEVSWLRSYAAAPIQVRGSLLGFLNLDSSIPGFFNLLLAERLQAFADHAGIAIENARLFEETQKRARQLALINEITHAAISAPDLKTMLDILANRLGELINADGAYITLWDPDLKRAIPAAAYGPMAEEYLRTAATPGEHSLTASVLSAERVLAADDVLHSPYIDAQIASQYPEKSLLGVPLIADGKKLGAALISFRTLHRFTFDEIALAEQVGSQIALAISKVQLLEAERRQTALLTRKNTLITALGIVAAKIENIPDPDSMMDTLGQQLSRLNIQSVIALVEPPKDGLVVQYLSLNPDLIGKVEKLIGLSLRNFHISEEQFQTLKGWMGDMGSFQTSLRSLANLFLPKIPSFIINQALSVIGFPPDSQTKSIVLPLATEEKTIGILILWGEDLEESDLPALAIFASQAAIALENARLYSDVQRLAVTDEMTGLYNRRGLFEIGNREVERALRFNRSLSVVMMDIDHFKLVNDTFGHYAGDQVLQVLGKRCRELIRGIDIGGRYGGEEFVFLLIENNLKNALQVAERLRSSFDGNTIRTDQADVSITVSLGVVEVSQETPDLASLIHQADRALYRAKRSGRNQVAALET